MCGDQVVIKGDVFHHICHVCRQGEGDQFEVITDHKAFLVELHEVEKKQAFAKVLQSRDLPRLSRPHIHLALSLPRFQTVDRVLEKMVELGVKQVHLFSSDFSFKKPKPGELSKKRQRWQKIIQGATQQTGRGEVMALTEPRPLGVLLSENFPNPRRKALVAYEGEGGESLAAWLQSLDPACDEVWMFVGGEGGFSRKDLELLKDYKLLPISLGDQVLRVETACVTLVSILKYSLGQM
jgi:16S rRNA (uracil1498-N3)-methyltransferase